MPEIPSSAWLQYPVALIVLVAVFVLMREFKAFVRERDEQWQSFLKAQRDSDLNTTREMMGEIKRLTQSLIDLRHDFDEAVAVMKERTRSKTSNRRKASDP